MKLQKILSTEFKKTLHMSRNNTLLFENITDSYLINNEIKVFNHPLLNKKFYSQLKEISEKKIIDKEKEKRYRFKPKLASYNFYGYIDYWYIILFINDFNSHLDFKFFEYLYVPKRQGMDNIINSFLYQKRQGTV